MNTNYFNRSFIFVTPMVRVNAYSCHPPAGTSSGVLSYCCSHPPPPIFSTVLYFQVVIIGAHSDSWDIGVGAVDDGGGVMITWEVLSIMRALDYQPRRTLRMVFWTAAVRPSEQLVEDDDNELLTEILRSNDNDN